MENKYLHEDKRGNSFDFILLNALSGFYYTFVKALIII